MQNTRYSHPINMAAHNELGKKGEEEATKYLKENGYEILAINWRHKHKEIDIIALHENLLIAVEVKTRSYGEAENLRDIISFAKMKYLIEATNAYIEQHNRTEEVQFDIIFINKTFKLQHIPDAFNALDLN